MIGVASADNKTTGRPITPGHVELFNLLCQQLATALEEARLYAEARARENENARLLSELRARTGELTLSQRVAVRLAATHAIHLAAQAVDTSYHLAGSSAIQTANPFERRFRDIHAVTQQVQGRSAHYENVGRFLFDLEVNETWL